MESALHSLRDIEGVLGSFVLDAHGTLLARDMPTMFDHETLRAASVRLSQLRAALEANGDGFDGCTARFGNHLLVLRAAEARTLCVLCPLGVNLNTLQMGLNLVARRVGSVEASGSLREPGNDDRRASSIPTLRPSLPPTPALPPTAPLTQTLSYEPQTQGHEASTQTLPPPPERPELVPMEPEPSRFFRGRPVR
jgi:predicted regulator of Ras-like GTPase activity (Roadblock/LC7/MglB family)